MSESNDTNLALDVNAGVKVRRRRSKSAAPEGSVHPVGVPVEGVVSGFAFGKAPLLGRAPRLIKISGAVLAKQQ